MNLKALSLAGLLAVSSTVMAAESAQPPYTVTFNIQNNSSHDISSWMSHIHTDRGECIFSKNSLVCKTNNKGELIESGSFDIDNRRMFIGPTINITTLPSSYGPIYVFYSPRQGVSLTLSNAYWDTKSNLTTTLIFADEQS